MCMNNDNNNPSLNVGDAVRITGGTFVNLTGKVVDISSNGYATVDMVAYGNKLKMKAKMAWMQRI